MSLKSRLKTSVTYWFSYIVLKDKEKVELIFGHSSTLKLSRRVSKLNHRPNVNRPFPHSTSVRTNNRTRARFGWTFSYICCIFVHSNLDSMPLFVGMRERSTALQTTDVSGQQLLWSTLTKLQCFHFGQVPLLSRERSSLFLGFIPVSFCHLATAGV